MLSLIPRSAALVDLGRGAHIDRRMLEVHVAERSHRLLDAGLGPGGRVAICSDDDAAILIDLLAIWHVGAVAVPLSTSLVATERRRLAQRIAPVIWIGDGAPEGVVQLGPAAPDPGRHAAQVLPGMELPASDSPALILMTSGTAGEPKGVVLSRHALQGAAASEHRVDWQRQASAGSTASSPAFRPWSSRECPHTAPRRWHVARRSCTGDCRSCELAR